MIDPLLQELRERFRETARVRLEEMRALVARLTLDRSDLGALERLATHFHGLTGMGGTYGFPRVSDLGAEAERSISPLMKRGRTPDEKTIERWDELIGEMASELD